MSQFRTIVESIINEANLKASIKNQIYNNISQLTNHLYKDEGWQGYNNILDVLNNMGFEVISGPSNDESHKNGYSVDGKEKSWDIRLEKDGMVLDGRIKAFAAGTVEYPFSAYDLTVVLW